MQPQPETVLETQNDNTESERRMISALAAVTLAEPLLKHLKAKNSVGVIAILNQSPLPWSVDRRILEMESNLLTESPQTRLARNAVAAAAYASGFLVTHGHESDNERHFRDDEHAFDFAKKLFAGLLQEAFHTCALHEDLDLLTKAIDLGRMFGSNFSFTDENGDSVMHHLVRKYPNHKHGYKVIDLLYAMPDLEWRPNHDGQTPESIADRCGFHLMPSEPKASMKSLVTRIMAGP